MWGPLRFFRRFGGAPAQSNEQALLTHFLRDVSVPQTFCEFGFDAHEFNCAGLVAAGWRGLLMDQDEGKVAAARGRFPRRVAVECHHIYRETIADLIARHFPPKTLGVLSVDVDGNDYWFLEVLLPSLPGVIICEYNASLLHQPLTVLYDPQFDRHAKHPRGFYHGASLSALTRLGAKHGYDLVGVSDGGLNAFFRRRALCPSQVALDPVEAWRPNRLRAGYNEGMTPDEQWASLKDLPFLSVS